jgi:hypothetical protein
MQPLMQIAVTVFMARKMAGSPGKSKGRQHAQSNEVIAELPWARLVPPVRAL